MVNVLMVPMGSNLPNSWSTDCESWFSCWRGGCCCCCCSGCVICISDSPLPVSSLTALEAITLGVGVVLVAILMFFAKLVRCVIVDILRAVIAAPTLLLLLLLPLVSPLSSADIADDDDDGPET